MNIGERIKQERLKLKLSQQQLADCIASKLRGPLSRVSISQWETGDTKGGIKPENLVFAAECLNVTEKWLVTGREPKSYTTKPTPTESHYQASNKDDKNFYDEVSKITTQEEKMIATEILKTVRKDLSINNSCVYCNKSLQNGAMIDHIIPLSIGGKNEYSNMVLVCPSCNSLKSDKTLSEFIDANNLNESDIKKRLKQLGKRF